jgi:putative spermidine/putrescine transport system substrate-binding protein
LQDLAFCGQFSQAVVPTNAAHHSDALKLANFLLSDAIQASVVNELGGFPAVALDNLPKELQAKLADVLPKSIPIFPTGDWEAAMNDGWYRNVAPKIDRTQK